MFVIRASLQVIVELSQQLRYGAVGAIDQSALSLLYSSRYLATLECIASADKQSRQIGSNIKTSTILQRSLGIKIKLWTKPCIRLLPEA